jgi:gluconate kinase
MNFRTFEPTINRCQNGKLPRISLYISNNQFRFNKYALLHMKITSISRAKFHFDNDRQTWLIEVTDNGFKFNMNNTTTPIVQSRAVTKAICEMFVTNCKTLYFEIGQPIMQTDTGTFYQLTFLN